MPSNIPSEGDVFTPKSDTLDVLLPSIHRKNIALPNFQRRWVWNPNMVRELLISVAYRYPAGSLLTMPIHKAAFALRPFEGAGETLEGKPGLMVLDGQQRLTSLYQSLYRSDGVNHEGRRYYFYVDVGVLMQDSDGMDVGDPYFDKALFFVAEDRDKRRLRYDGLKPLYELTTPDQELAAGALPLWHVFDSDQLTHWKERFLISKAGDSLKQYQELSRQWDILVQTWLTRLKTYRFPVVELDENMPLGAICHIFEKVNSTGVPLDVFDLCNAILWAQGFHLNDEWAKTWAIIAQELPMQPISGTFFLQGLSLLASLAKRRAKPDQNIAVSCRKQDLMEMTKATVMQWWNPLVVGYRDAAKFMRNQGILAERILPYSTMIIPLAAILADLHRRKGEVGVNSAIPKVEQWYWCSVFSQRYSGQTETSSAKDMSQVLDWIDGGDAPDVVRTFGFRSDYLQEIVSIRNAIYKGVLCLLARNHAQDFGGGGLLSTDLFFDTRQDHHHIFPTYAVGKLGIKDPRTGTIVNKTLISAAVNRSIGGSLPSDYLSNWRNKLGGTVFDDALLSHGISPDCLASNDWESFVLERREKLRGLVAEVCGGNVLPFSDGLGLAVESLSDEE